MRYRTLLLLQLVLYCTAVHAQFNLTDKFNRNLAGNKITLVDWEGYMANPAIKLTLAPASGTTLPITATITANGPRLYFDMPSTVGATGPSKTITFSTNTAQDFYLSIFPDRGDGDENYTLTIASGAGNQTFPVFVKDQDSAIASVPFNLIVDFSQDKPAYNFYNNSATNRGIANTAAQDWAYFLNNMNFDTVLANTQFTYIWDDNYSGGNFITNANGYRGFLLYCYGYENTVSIRSGGAPSTSGFQSIGATPTQLRRSGTHELEHRGNYNILGWNTSITDDTWYVATNLGNVPNDLYSINMHEIGHALTFNPGYPVFSTYKTQGFINEASLVSYQGGNVPIDAFDHLSNGQTDDALKTTDRISKKGAFGSDYALQIPRGRWLITKLNLLVMQAIGYQLRNTSCLKPPVISTSSLAPANMGVAYQADVVAEWGIPFFNYTISAGAFPPGLSINSFTGSISGTPTTGGTYNFTAKVYDYDSVFVTKNLFITVNSFTWTGAAGTDWNNPANWSGNLVPVAGADVTIPAVPNLPLLSSAVTIGKITLGGIVKINGQTLSINGAVSGSGTFSGSATSNLIINGNAGVLNFTPGFNLLQSFTVNPGATAIVPANFTLVK